MHALIPCIPFSRLAGEGDNHSLYIKNLAFVLKQLDHFELPLSRHPEEGCRACEAG